MSSVLELVEFEVVQPDETVQETTDLLFCRARELWAWEKDWEEAGGGNEVTQEEQTSG